MKSAVSLALLICACSSTKAETYPEAIECVSKYSTYLTVIKNLGGKEVTADMMSVGSALWQRALSLGHEAGKTEAEVSADLSSEDHMRSERLIRENPSSVPAWVETEGQACLSKVSTQ